MNGEILRHLAPAENKDWHVTLSEGEESPAPIAA